MTDTELTAKSAAMPRNLVTQRTSAITSIWQLRPMPSERPPTRRLQSITVDKLFGVFDHPIRLKEERITIIHGPNGFGKTAILRIVQGFFERHYLSLRNVPFNSVTFEIEGHANVSVRQAVQDIERKPKRKQLLFSSKDDSWEWQQLDHSRRLLAQIDDRFPWLRRIDDDTWFDSASGEQMGTEELLDRYPDMFPRSIRDDKTPSWLKEIQDSVDVYLIRANRLESPEPTEHVRYQRRPTGFMTPAVVTYARDLAARIQMVQSEYATLSQSLDRTFPVRIMSAEQSTTASLEDVSRQLAELENERRSLIETGLLEHVSQESFPQIPQPTHSQLGVLSVYINDVKRKLEVFRVLRERLALFRDLINKRFLYKKVRIDKTDGMVFETDGGQILKATDLSTGEQHEVVILYQLLFLIQPNSLVLIDEPEISLHVAWQKSFLKDLTRIKELAQVDFLIATHSPQIIGNRWDLTVELKGPGR